MPKIELLHIDCMEYMATLPDKAFELAIADPEYGGNDAIGMVNNNNFRKQATKRTAYHLFANVAPDEQYFKELKRVSKNQIVWGGNFFGLIGGVIVWQKNGTAFGEGEIAICSTHKSVRFFEYTWNGMIQSDMKNKEQRIHPTQKPVALYKWLLHNYAKPGDRILDTHGGSRSLAIACHQMGFDHVSCELDKDYHEASVKRFKEQTAQMQIFQP